LGININIILVKVKKAFTNLLNKIQNRLSYFFIFYF